MVDLALELEELDVHPHKHPNTLLRKRRFLGAIWSSKQSTQKTGQSLLNRKYQQP